MTTIFERVDTALTTLGVPFANRRYRTTTGATLPDLYLTYFLVSSADLQSADDGETLRSELIQINIFSRNGLVNLPDVDGAMQAAGFAPAEKRQLPDEPDSEYFGFAQDYIFVEET